jgi:hypothetical protein
MVDVKILLTKLSNSNIGIDESSSLYLGHAILNYSHLHIDEDLLYNCIQRVIKCDLNPIVKSYCLPISYVFATKKELLPEFIFLII